MFSADFRAEFQRECRRGYDILHLEETWTGWLGLGLDRTKSVLNIHNLYDLDESQNVPLSLKDRTWRRWRRDAEHRILRSYPHLIALSSQLKEAAQAIAANASISIVPLGMDSSLYRFIPSEHRQAAPLITLIGSMHWTPSYSAAVRLLERLWPCIKAQVPEARIQIIGWNARTALSRFLNIPDVAIHENVADTQPFFASASVMLYAPTQGSGMKVKIMEAFAYGVPVVTTLDGVEGLPAIDGVHAGIASDDNGLIERAVHLLQHFEMQEKYRVAARRLIETHCDPVPTVGAVEECYARIMSSRQEGLAASQRLR